MKIAFFGGSFNPPHLGHMNLGLQILEHRLADRVLFVPAWIPPHKDSAGMASFEDRLEMLRGMTSEIPGFAVSAIERERGGISYTVDTLDLLSRREPENEYLLLIGSDSLMSLHSWHEAERLVSSYGILCYPRPGFPVDPFLLKQYWSGNNLQKLLSAERKDLPVLAVSSTELRRNLSERRLTEGLLNDKVSDYIDQRSLYCMNHDPEVKEYSVPTTAELADYCAEIAYDRKAKDIVKLDLSQYSSVAEVFLICTGTSSPHLRAITEKIRRSVLDRYNIRSANQDGSPESHWMILDFGNVMVHVFTEETRELYQLENLWSEAPREEAIKKLEAKAKASRLI